LEARWKVKGGRRYRPRHPPVDHRARRRGGPGRV